jgi:two-component system, sensor histidine kinase LadS
MRTWRYLLFLLVGALIAGSADSNSTLSPGATFIPNGDARQSLNANLEYIEDARGTLTVTDIASARGDAFQPYTRAKKLGYDFKGKAFWVRFTVDAHNYASREWFLTYDYEHIDNLQVYYPSEGAWHRFELDARLPYEGRLFKTSQYTVGIPTVSAPTTYYVRFAPDYRFFEVSLSWSGARGFVETTTYSALLHGLFFGALGAIWLYNLALFAFLRDRLYFYYIYYLGCFTATFFYIYGMQHFLNLTGYWIESAFAAAGYLAIHGLVVFTQRFLSLEEHFKWLNRYLVVIKWLLVVGAVAAFVQPVGQPFRILNVIILLTVPVIAIAGILRSRTYSPARLYSVGWALFALALVSLAARSLNLLSVNLLTTYGVMLAAVWEAALFSLALGYRIKLSEAQATEERLHAADVEREASQARERFLSMVSHELRSPLASVSFGLDMLELRASDAKQSEAVGRIRRAADNIEGQLRDLLTLASGSHGTLEIRPLAFDATQLVVDYAEERRDAAEAKKLALEVSVPDAEMLVIADPIRLAQALTNLISNAIKYTDRGRIDVVLDPIDKERGLLRFSVADTGIGIPGVVRPQVFKPFSRFDAMDRGQPGSGIGLAVVKTVVDHLGGTVTVSSEEGGGTKFTVEIPVAMPPAKREEVKQAGKRRLLVVDDRDDVLTGLAGLASELGYQVDQALGPAVGANLLAVDKYDVVLIDLDMPVKPGRELASETRRGGGPNATSWLIAFSAASNGPQNDDLWPFNAFLAKPVSRHSLTAAIESGVAAAPEVSRTLQAALDAAKPPESALGGVSQRAPIHRTFE